MQRALSLYATFAAVRVALRCGHRDCLLYRYWRAGMHGPSEGAYQ